MIEYRGRYYKIIGEYERAEKLLREAVDTFVEIHRSSGAVNLSKEALTSYFELQQFFIGQGKPMLALQINTEELARLTSMSFEDISYYWHLTHLAYIFTEYNYQDFAEVTSMIG